MPQTFTWHNLPDNNEIDIQACSSGEVYIRLEQKGDERDEVARVYVSNVHAREIACQLIRASYAARPSDAVEGE